MLLVMPGVRSSFREVILQRALGIIEVKQLDPRIKEPNKGSLPRAFGMVPEGGNRAQKQSQNMISVYKTQITQQKITLDLPLKLLSPTFRSSSSLKSPKKSGKVPTLAIKIMGQN